MARINKWFQCKICKIIVQRKFKIWSHIRNKHGENNLSLGGEKLWKNVEINEGLKIKLKKLNQDKPRKEDKTVEVIDIDSEEEEIINEDDELATQVENLNTLEENEDTDQKTKEATKSQEIDEDDDVIIIEEKNVPKKTVKVPPNISRPTFLQIYHQISTSNTNQSRGIYYSCPESRCNFMCKNLSLLLTHHQVNHLKKTGSIPISYPKEPLPVFKCDSCLKVYKTKVFLRFHKISHTHFWTLLDAEQKNDLVDLFCYRVNNHEFIKCPVKSCKFMVPFGTLDNFEYHINSNVHQDNSDLVFVRDQNPEEEILGL